jgi:hypothetical protein
MPDDSISNKEISDRLEQVLNGLQEVQAIADNLTVSVDDVRARLLYELNKEKTMQ